jgi:hypothetical protein
VESRKLLDLSSKTYATTTAPVFTPEEGFAELKGAYELHKSTVKLQAELDASLAVLTKYAEALEALTSDDPIKQLNTASQDLGKSIDSATKEWNDNFAGSGPKLSLIGSTIAAATRGLGGLFIRYEQQKYLQQFVNDGVPIINTLMPRIVELLKKLKSELPAMEEKLANVWRKAALNSQILSYETVRQVEADYTKLKQTEELIDSSIKAAQTYQAAANQLQKNVQVHMDLKWVIEEIEALAAEVKAAQKLKNDMDKK